MGVVAKAAAGAAAALLGIGPLVGGCAGATAGSGHGGARPAPAPVERGTGVHGRVVGAGGSPGAYCMLQAAAQSPWAPAVPEAAVLTDERGRYTWALAPATYTLRARCGQRSGTAEGVEVVAGAMTRVRIVVAGAR